MANADAMVEPSTSWVTCSLDAAWLDAGLLILLFLIWIAERGTAMEKILELLIEVPFSNVHFWDIKTPPQKNLIL